MCFYIKKTFKQTQKIKIIKKNTQHILNTHLTKNTKTKVKTFKKHFKHY